MFYNRGEVINLILEKNPQKRDYLGDLTLMILVWVLMVMMMWGNIANGPVATKLSECQKSKHGRPHRSWGSNGSQTSSRMNMMLLLLPSTFRGKLFHSYYAHYTQF